MYEANNPFITLFDLDCKSIFSIWGKYKRLFDTETNFAIVLDILIFYRGSYLHNSFPAPMSR